MSSIFQFAKNGNTNIPRENSSVVSEAQPSLSVFEAAKQLPEQEMPDHKSNFARQAKQYAARLGEGIVGLPGDIVKAPGNILRYIAENLGGESLSKGADQLESDPILKSMRGLYGNIPGSNDIRKFTKDTFKGSLEPQSAKEELVGDIITDLPSLVTPIKGKVAPSILKALGISSAANFAPKVAKHVGAEEGTQQNVKMGTLLLSSLLGKNGFKGAEKFKDNLYAEANKLVPSESKVSAKNLGPALDKFKMDLKKGGSANSKVASLKKVDEIKNAIKAGRIPIDELTNFKKSINEARSGLWQEFGGDTKGRLSAKRNLDQVAKIIDNTLSEYGEKNPAWEKIYREANEAHGAIAQSRKISNTIERYAKKFAPHTVGAVVIDSLLYPSSVVPLASGAGAAFGAVKGGELISRIYKSPVLRKYYLDVLKQASIQDAAAMNHSLELLDKKASEDPEIQDFLKGLKK